MKHNKLYYFIILLLAVSCFTSCEDVIDLDLNKTKPNIVIEASVTNQLQPQQIKISLTKAFTEDNDFIGVKGALVTVQEENGMLYNFTESTTGNYKSISFAGKPGRNYTLKVVFNNKTYTAQSTMPPLVVLDSLTVTELSFFGSKNKFIQVNYQDIKNIANQYNYVISVNNEIRNAYYVDNDRFNDGSKVTNTIFTQGSDLKMGDKVTLDFQCIDMNVYRYFFAISQITGNGGPPTSPSNPDSNFDNGALGYFSAHTSQKVSITIP